MDPELQEALGNLSAEAKSWRERESKKVELLASALGKSVLAIEEAGAALGKHETRMNDMEQKMKRTSAIGGLGSLESEHTDPKKSKAFNSYLRGGIEALDADERSNLVVADDSKGGYLAPGEMLQEILRDVTLFSPIRQIARVRQVGVGEIYLPKRTGRMTGNWVEETEDRTETGPTYGQNSYVINEGAAYVDISNKMLDDAAFDMLAELSFDFAEEFGRLEGAAFVSGDGVKKPLGFMQAASGLAWTPSGVTNQVTADSLIDLFFALPSPYRANGNWVMNSTTQAKVAKLKDGNGDYLLAMAGINGAPSTMLLGKPVIEAPDMPDVATGAYPIAFGDFRQGYRIFDRVTLSIMRDPFSLATKGQTRFHGRRRVTGGVAKAEAIRKLLIS